MPLSSAISAYKQNAALKQMHQELLNTAPEKSQGASFDNVLKSIVSESIQGARKSEAMAQQSVLGNVSLIDLAAAENQADFGLKTAISTLKSVIGAINAVNQISVG